MKKVLGLDLGTNSIGWALIEHDFENKKGSINGLGSRIIPMSQDILGNFDAGQSHSQTAERTSYRGTRRLYQRDNLRRERLHRILNILDFLPEHYANQIDFENKKGQFLKEVKLNYRKNDNDEYEFLFIDSFNKMVDEFKQVQPQLFYKKRNGKETKIPYDWTLYYLREKALKEKISKEELAWIILNFNQKRGYYQLRGDELSKESETKKDEKYYALEVLDTIETEDTNDKGTWYKVILRPGFGEENWVYKRQSKEPLNNWIGTIKEFIITTTVDKKGNSKRSFRAPKEDDWGLLKKKTEQELEEYLAKDFTNKSVGSFIFEKLLQNPTQKIRGKLIKTIEREYYKKELIAILDKQIELHIDLQNDTLYQECIEELYPRNEAHQNNLSKHKDKFKHLFVEDVIFYQRPLKSQKSNIGGCQYESYTLRDKEGNKLKDDSGKDILKPIKAISKSNPLFQEFRLWQWLHNLKILQTEKTINGKTTLNADVTNELLPSTEDWVELFDFLKAKKEIDLKGFLKYFIDKGLVPKQPKTKKGESPEYTHRWNYPEDKTYPACDTHASFISRLKKVNELEPELFLTPEREKYLWHIIYSVSDAKEFEQALKTFAKKYSLDEESFVASFIKYPPYKSDYGAYSEKAIKKLLPLIRMGKYWDETAIHPQTKDRIEKISTGEFDDKIRDRVREKTINLTETEHFQGLPLWLAGYIVYDRHSESGDLQKWNYPQDIDKFLHQFKQHSLRNPIVEQVVLETLRTVRDIWNYHGKGEKNFFKEIHVELGREMKNPAEKRKRMSERNTENENANTRVRELLKEMINDGARPHSPSHQEILKIYEADVVGCEELPDDIVKIRKKNSPSKKDIERYKLWLGQKYISPYTGKPIPLSKLFTIEYQIEHIIPQSRYFDDSLSNKIICESSVNQLKDNQTAYEFIQKHGGAIEDGYPILTWESYETHCKRYFKKNRTKLRNLLSDEIPEGFINRQLNDSRYISKLIKGLLSNIVREEGEQEATSKYLISVTGAITSKLKQNWGLNDKWNELILPRFKRLNKLTESDDFTVKNTNGIIIPTVPDELKAKFNKKRIDHRHHALDALVIATCTRKHIQYLNSLNNKKDKFDLQPSLMVKNKEGSFTKHFKLPWETFPVNVKDGLDKTIVSFKQNLRVINKTNNKYWKYVKQKDGTYKKELVKQTKGDNWAIRKPLHTPMPYGEKKYFFSVLEIAKNVGKRNLIVDDEIRTKVEDIFVGYGKVRDAQEELKKNPIQDENRQDIKFCVFKMPQVRYRKRQPITKLANRSSQGGIKTTEQAINFINKVSDTVIRKGLLLHLKENEYDIDKAFSIEGIEEFNRKRQIPVYKLPIAESSTEKFALGNKKEINKKKFGEAEGGTNLFFAIYQSKDGKRSFETIPLNKVIAHQKLVAHLPKDERIPVPLDETKRDDFLFSLSPNDLVYVPTDEERENPNSVDFDDLSKEQLAKVYKMVSCTGGECHFTPNNNSTEIKKNENGTNSKNERIQTFLLEDVPLDNKDKPVMIKNSCWKLKIDRLGNVLDVIR